MVAQASWLDVDDLEVETDDDEERWHVVMPSGEQKVLTLEQLDDLYRLEIIDEATPLWQPSMKTWTTLGEVAGIEEAPAAVRPAPRPSTPKLALVPQSENYSPVPLPAARPAPVVESWPPSAVHAWPAQAPSAPARQPHLHAVRSSDLPAPETIRPFASDIADDDDFLPPRKSGGGFGAFFVLLAAAAGLAVTLQRNDLIREAARSVGQEAAYGNLETRLGASVFGTPRSLEAYGTSSGPSGASTETPAKPLEETPATAPASKTAALDALKAEPVAEAPKSVPAAKAEPQPEPEKKAEAPAPEKDDGAKSKALAGAPGGKPMKVASTSAPTAKARTRAAARPAPKPAPAKAQPAAVLDTPRPKSVSKQKNDVSQYDPLNPDL